MLQFMVELLYMGNMDKDMQIALGIVTAPPVQRPENRVDLSRAIKLRFQKGLELKEIGALMGVSDSAVCKALAPYRNLMANVGPAVSDDAMGELLSAAATVHLASSVDPEKVAKMSGKDNAVAAGIFLDKSRLFKGQATSHTSVFFHVVSESDRASQPQDIDITPSNPPSPEDYLD